MSTSPNPFSEKYEKLADAREASQKEKKKFEEPVLMPVMPGLECSVCGKILKYSDTERAAGTIKTYCSKQCKKNRHK